MLATIGWLTLSSTSANASMPVQCSSLKASNLNPQQLHAWIWPFGEPVWQGVPQYQGYPKCLMPHAAGDAVGAVTIIITVESCLAACFTVISCIAMYYDCMKCPGAEHPGQGEAPHLAD